MEFCEDSLANYTNMYVFANSSGNASCKDRCKVLQLGLRASSSRFLDPHPRVPKEAAAHDLLGFCDAWAELEKDRDAGASDDSLSSHGSARVQKAPVRLLIRSSAPVNLCLLQRSKSCKPELRSVCSWPLVVFLVLLVLS